MTSRILVPFDGSDPAHRALEYAFENRSNAEITILTVVAEVGSVECSGRLSTEEGSGCFSAEAEERLNAARGIADEYGITIRTAVDVGPPCRVIPEYADTEGVDHIVIGSHGRTGISRIVVGSVAETVVRRASPPVTTIQ